MTTPTLTKPDAIRFLQASICAESFPDFLGHITIEADGGDDDDPDAPERGPLKFVPYDYQLAAAERWQGGGNEIILKERQLGFSWLDAAYAVWVAGFHQSSHVALFSKHKFESKKLMRKCRYIINHLPSHLKPKVLSLGVEVIEFANDSMISAFPSTEDAGIGETNKLAIFDEFGFHEFGEQNLSAVLPTVRSGGQVLINSTSSPEMGPTGAFHDRFDKAGGFLLTGNGVGPTGPNGFRPVFVGRGSRPGRGEDWYAATKAQYAEERTYSAFYPATPQDAFQGREGLVYPKAAAEYHLQPAPCSWEECYLRFWSTDLGKGDPTVVLVGGVQRTKWGPHLHIYDALYQPTGALGANDIGEYLSPWHARAKFTKGADDPAPGGATVSETLKAVYGLPADLATNTRFEGIELVTTWLANAIKRAESDAPVEGWLSFDPKVWDGFAREFVSYRYRKNTDPHTREKYDTSTPVDHHGDRLDALRYMLMTAYRELLSPARPRQAYSGVQW